MKATRERDALEMAEGKEEVAAMRPEIEESIQATAQKSAQVIGIVLLCLVLLGPFVSVAWGMLGTVFPWRDDLVIVALAVCYLVAAIALTKGFIVVAQGKGYYGEGGVGWLWFLGVFATPIALGLLLLSLPGKDGADGSFGSRGTTDGAASTAAPAESELPKF